MFDHAGIHVADLARSRRCYTSALAPLGVVERSVRPDAVG